MNLQPDKLLSRCGTPRLSGPQPFVVRGGGVQLSVEEQTLGLDEPRIMRIQPIDAMHHYATCEHLLRLKDGSNYVRSVSTPLLAPGLRLYDHGILARSSGHLPCQLHVDPYHCLLCTSRLNYITIMSISLWSKL
jgi:hypothetical protein